MTVMAVAWDSIREEGHLSPSAFVLQLPSACADELMMDQACRVGPTKIQVPAFPTAHRPSSKPLPAPPCAYL